MAKYTDIDLWTDGLLACRKENTGEVVVMDLGRTLGLARFKRMIFTKMTVFNAFVQAI